jgi:hypothetical protein
MVWTEKPISTVSLRQFARDLGSTTSEVNDDAVIERGEARVYISRADPSDQENVLPDDVEYAKKRMGTTPASMLSIRIGHGIGSVDLATDVAGRAVETWGGFLDENEPA